MSFKPEEFMQTQTEDASATEYIPIPEGEYTAVVAGVEGRETKTGKAVMDVTWQLDDPSNEDTHNKKVRQSIFLDLSDGGALRTGKGQNVQLGRLREAVSQNTPGMPWAPSMLEGQVAIVTVKQRSGDEGQIYTDVKGVTKIG